MKKIFENISDRNIDKLLYLLEGHTLSFEKGSNISESIRGVNLLYIVLEGSIQIIKNDILGNKITLDTIEENNVFLASTFNLSNNEYDIIAKEECKIIYMDFNSIMNVEETSISYYNQFIKNLLDILSGNLTKVMERIDILSNKTIRDKLLAYFKMKTKGNNTKIIYLPFSFTEFADYLSVNRSALSREISNLKDEGFIEVSGRKIKLLYTIV